MHDRIEIHLLTGWATHFLYLVLSHYQSYLRQIMHLSAFLELSGHALQRLLAVSADQGTMLHYLIRTGHLHQSVPCMPRLPSRRSLAAVTLAPGLSPWTVTRQRFAAIVAVFG
jgi:hypothetical protein